MGAYAVFERLSIMARTRGIVKRGIVAIRQRLEFVREMCYDNLHQIERIRLSLHETTEIMGMLLPRVRVIDGGADLLFLRAKG